MKGKIVFDIPNSCRECQMFIDTIKYCCADESIWGTKEYKEHKDFLINWYAGSRPNWCPIIKEKYDYDKEISNEN